MRYFQKIGLFLFIVFLGCATISTAQSRKALSYFQIAGDDNVFVDATAVIDGDDVLVSAPSVSSPKNVAFAYSNKAIPNLTNKERLLACPFRTDKWNYSITLKVK